MRDEFSNDAAGEISPNAAQTEEHTSGTKHTNRADAIRQLTQELTRHQDYLRELARRYNWWQAPDVALQFPARLVAHVMNLGTFADISELSRRLGDDCLRRVLENVEAGQLAPRSWHYWHYRLNNVEPGHIPPMPRRRIA